MGMTALMCGVLLLGVVVRLVKGRLWWWQWAGLLVVGFFALVDVLRLLGVLH